MIVDDKIINLCNQVLDNYFRTDYFIIEERNETDCIVSSMNTSSTSLLKIRVGDNNSIIFPTDNYILPVEKEGNIEEGYTYKARLRGLIEYDCNDTGHYHAMMMCSGFDNEIFKDDYAPYPFEDFKKILVFTSKNYSNPAIEFVYRGYKSVISTGILEDLLIAKNIEYIQFKLLGTDDKLYFKYNAIFEDFPVTVYAVVAPRLEVDGDAVIVVR